MRLTPESWQHAFSAYVKVNNSHWTGPPFEVVERMLEKNGTYEFGFSSMGTWASKLRVTQRGEEVEFMFVKNEELPAHMRRKLDDMEVRFRALLSTGQAPP